MIVRILIGIPTAFTEAKNSSLGTLINTSLKASLQYCNNDKFPFHTYAGHIKKPLTFLHYFSIKKNIFHYHMGRYRYVPVPVYFVFRYMSNEKNDVYSVIMSFCLLYI